MITLNSAIHQSTNVGKIVANKKVYTSPSVNDKNWDICYKFNFPYNILCNFTASQFKHDGVKIYSMEGFLQSLKVKDKATQNKICTLPGFLAKKVGNYLKKNGKFDRKTVYWQGQEYNRYSKDFAKVIDRAYDSKFKQDRLFRTVLNSSKGRTLTHTIGKSDPNDTILTEKEFIQHLDKLREKTSAKEKVKTFFRDTKNILFSHKTTKSIADTFKNNKATFVNDVYVCGENPLSNIAKLRKSGVKNVIDVNVPSEEAKKRAKLLKKHNIDYLNITLDNHKKIEDPTQTIKKIVNMYNEGKPTYIIADPKNEANIVLGINYLYNPKATLADAVMFGTPQKNFVSRLASFSRKINNNEINSLGWKEDFSTNIQERKNTIFNVNA